MHNTRLTILAVGRMLKSSLFWSAIENTTYLVVMILCSVKNSDIAFIQWLPSSTKAVVDLVGDRQSSRT